MKFKESQFNQFKDLIYQRAGLSISESKREMFKTKIDKLMRRHSIPSYDEYYRIVVDNTNVDMVQDFINTLTTNTTEFFREKAHFEYIKNNIENIMQDAPRIKTNREIRVWCAASSSGQEPVTITMTLKECLPDNYKIKLLATDISSKVLNKAMKGLYNDNDCDGIPKYYLTKYFSKLGNSYQVKPEILNSISYRYFNLMQEFNFKNYFDIIFCRNVMIYFDNDVQETLVNKFYRYLIPNGLLFIGHSESLINKRHRYRYVAPSLYKK